MHPFMLTGPKDEKPAGHYLEETDKGPLVGLLFLSYRRVKVLVNFKKD
jgi:hypothetical protein